MRQDSSLGGRRRPNILVIFNDDHGAWATGAYGNRDINTPSIDHLAKMGVLMENAFTPTPVCSPARACFLTGRMASQHGVHDFVAAAPEFHTRRWLDDEVTMPELLHAAGYRVGMTGKWHLGNDETPHPGFDEWFALTGDYPMLPGGTHRYSYNGKIETLTGYKTQILTDRAVDFLRKCDDDQPFFLFVGYTGTHSPWTQQPERLVTHYRAHAAENVTNLKLVSNYPFGRLARESLLPTRHTPEETLAQYYAAVSHLDEGVGRLVDELEALGLRDETVIVYTSDHGLCFGHHGIWGKGNGTLPLNMLEEAIRIPLIVSGHTSLFGGQRRTEFVDHLDLFATLLDCAEVARPEHGETYYPGRSFRPYLFNDVPGAPWRDVQFGEYGNVRMIRSRTHKLVRRYPDGPSELFDLSADPRETRNVVDVPEHACVREDLANRLDAYFAKYENPLKSGLSGDGIPRQNANSPWYSNAVTD